MASIANAEELDQATCSVCKDVFKNPVKISCDHTFCESCITSAWRIDRNQTCPICRTSADGSTDTDYDMIGKMSELAISCANCHMLVVLREYRRHQRICGRATSFSGPSTSLGLGDRSGPNIYTFPCPYCSAKNLDREGLLSHVATTHAGRGNPKVVCPICKVMPWGNGLQLSGNFLDHIKLRHRFDYDRFVDLNQDEDTALKNTLMLSLEQY